MKALKVGAFIAIATVSGMAAAGAVLTAILLVGARLADEQYSELLDGLGEWPENLEPVLHLHVDGTLDPNSPLLRQRPDGFDVA